MKIGVFNCNGLIGKDQSIIQFMDQENLDILFMVETWLRPIQDPPIRGNIVVNINKPISRTGDPEEV